jgi:hypothetical protein
MLRIEFVGTGAVFISDHIEKRPRTKTVPGRNKAQNSLNTLSGKEILLHIPNLKDGRPENGDNSVKD